MSVVNWGSLRPEGRILISLVVPRLPTSSLPEESKARSLSEAVKSIERWEPRLVPNVVVPPVGEKTLSLLMFPELGPPMATRPVALTRT